MIEFILFLIVGPIIFLGAWALISGIRDGFK